jgi:hypothetical protein
MRVIDLRLWFIGLTVVVFICTSYQNVRWLIADFDGLAQNHAREMVHIESVSARTPSPRIIFAGGSSVIYAVDAKAIERDLGIRVINMAMSNRIGSDANYFNYLLPKLREGDLVIYGSASWLLKLTQEAEANEMRDARRLADRLWEVAQIDLADRENVDWPLLLPIADMSVFNRLSARERVVPESSIWQRDDHGGMIKCLMRSAALRSHDAPSAAPGRKLITHISKFVRDVEARGANLIFIETPIFITARERAKWVRYRKELRSQLAKVAPVLDAADARIFSADPRNFCDSAFHVDDDVRVEFSQSLSMQLRQLPAVLALQRNGTGAARLQLGDVDKLTHSPTD